MELVISNLFIPIEKDGIDEYLYAASQKMVVDDGDISIVKILSKALDLRKKEQFFYNLSLVISIADTYKNKQKFSLYITPIKGKNQAKHHQERPIIVGFGPAGMFAALELIEYGLKPIVFERGKKIEERSVDVQRFIRERRINPESNVQFGEGGAGSYSDGKLFSRRNNNTSIVNQVLQTFVKFGAPAEIEYISKPHLGTDVLCKIVRNIRRHVLERGGEIHYNSKMTDILMADGKASGIVINDVEEYVSSSIYIALGHSARDTFKMIHQKGVAVEQRKISVGVRIEHPVEAINFMRYGDKYQHYPGLGAASYSLNHANLKIRRGVYTFCMCPGGEVVNASSEQGALVLNGMSYSHRSSPFSNAALVVNCHTDDYPSVSPLAGLAFQEDIERKAFRAGGENWKVPAQNLMDFLGASNATALHENSCKTGLVPSEIKDIFPSYVIDELLVAFQKWKETVPVFVSSQAILMAPETRTSSPVRITRNENFESINTKNIYPIGEGAGYAGGITSSAADAVKAVQRHML